MSIIKEFKEFAMRGSVVDLAVGVIIGGAFGKIVTSLVDDVIMPPIGYLTGGVDFSDLKWVLVEESKADNVAEVAIKYGSFINVVIQFLIVAFCIFILVKGLNSLKRKQPEPESKPAGPTQEQLLTEIRDLLKK